MKVVGIHQPNYMPWPGYFYKLRKSDVFVILDTVDLQQGNTKSLTSRAKVKGANGEILLTVPLKKGESKLIQEIEIDNTQSWAKKHLKSVQLSYTKAPFFKDYFPILESVLTQKEQKFSRMTTNFIREIANALDIQTPFVLASELHLTEEGRNERIVKICQALGGDTYLCGKGGSKYMDEAVFASGGIQVAYTDFIPKAYNQLHGTFLPGLSVLDSLMNIGKDGVLELIG
jgi:hypothetical protein